VEQQAQVATVNAPSGCNEGEKSNEGGESNEGDESNEGEDNKEGEDGHEGYEHIIEADKSKEYLNGGPMCIPVVSEKMDAELVVCISLVSRGHGLTMDNPWSRYRLCSLFAMMGGFSLSLIGCFSLSARSGQARSTDIIFRLITLSKKNYMNSWIEGQSAWM
jgi:hypothetical protein